MYFGILHSLIFAYCILRRLELMSKYDFFFRILPVWRGEVRLFGIIGKFTHFFLLTSKQSAVISL